MITSKINDSASVNLPIAVLHPVILRQIIDLGLKGVLPPARGSTPAPRLKK
jgi:hypothetical protein